MSGLPRSMRNLLLINALEYVMLIRIEIDVCINQGVWSTPGRGTAVLSVAIFALLGCIRAYPNGGSPGL